MHSRGVIHCDLRLDKRKRRGDAWIRALLGGIVWVFEGPKLALPKPGIMVYFRAKYPQMAEFRLKYDFIDPDDMQIIVSL